MKRGKPVHRPERLHDSPYSIVAKYQSEYRGLVEYYRLALNLGKFDHLKWAMETSLAKTLAAKWRTTVTKVYGRLKTTVHTPEGPRKVLQVVVEREEKAPLVAWWGGISLRRRPDAVLDDQPQPVWNRRTELLERLLADECELCGSRENVEVHHVRRLSDLWRKGRAKRPKWVEVMASRQRKTLVVCLACHLAIHGDQCDRAHGRGPGVANVG
jgi:hypothetical protein